jgi:SAM-dependent methyltransferase
MNERLLALLREPGTGAALEPEGGGLRSAATGRRYPVRRGIPRFVAPDDYSRSFGLQWDRFAETQLDSATGASSSRRRFDAETGWRREDLEGATVLDGGCGAGRFAEIAARRGAHVVALDHSAAVEAAARNLAAHAGVDLVQADLADPPFAPGTFDFVYSIGVLQHTPDPYATLRSALALCRPGGRFAFTAYGRRWYTGLHAKYLVRPVTRRLPSAALLRAVELAAVVLFPLTDLLFGLPLIGRAARFAIPFANPAGHDDLTREQRRAQAVLDTFDMLSPAYDRPLRADRVEAVLRDAGVASYELARTVPIEVTGRR